MDDLSTDQLATLLCLAEARNKHLLVSERIRALFHLKITPETIA